MSASEVALFVDAVVQRHYERRGPHPHKYEDLWKIEEASIESEAKSFWWTHPSLNVKDGPGAKIFNESWKKRLWTHPQLEAQEREMGERADQWEHDHLD